MSEHAPHVTTDRVFRPLGLTLAIASTAVIYGLLPMLRVYFLWRINRSADDALMLGGVDVTTWDWLGGALGAVMLALCVWVWIGRPYGIQFVFVGLLLVLTAVHLYRIVEVWQTDIDPLSGGPSQQRAQDLFTCEFPALVVVPLYVVWYLNRAPARAFFRRVPLPALGKAPDAAVTTSTQQPVPPEDRKIN